MGFRFRKSIKIAPGIKVNLSAGGVSTTIGKRGASVNIGKRGTRGTVGIPGTGISYSEKLSSPASGQDPAPTTGPGWLGWFVIGLVVVVVWLFVR
jgi:hypothetical protein